MRPMRRLGAAFSCVGLVLHVLGALACREIGAQPVVDELPPERRGVVAFTYQYAESQDLVSSQIGTLPSAPITTHLIDFDVQYVIKPRWTVFGGLPLISRKFEGPPSHDPMMIIPPHPESEFVDDHEYHTFWQDWRLGARYLLKTEPVTIEPFVSLGLPSTDYPFFGAAAVGRNLQFAEVGTNIGYRPPFLRWYFGLEAGYVFSEEPLDININATRISGEAVYFVNPRIALTTFFSSKNGKGWAVSATPFDRTSELWYHHDQFTRHNFINAGLGVDWSLNERHVLNFTMIRMVHAEDVFDINEALSISLKRSF
jgi:hypothetical protein